VWMQACCASCCSTRLRVSERAGAQACVRFRCGNGNGAAHGAGGPRTRKCIRLPYCHTASSHSGPRCARRTCAIRISWRAARQGRHRGTAIQANWQRTSYVRTVRTLARAAYAYVREHTVRIRHPWRRLVSRLRLPPVPASQRPRPRLRRCLLPAVSAVTCKN
jgi:hypothetical protein